MKLALASLALLAGMSGAASAQNLTYGVTLGNVQSVRDTNVNMSTITGSLANLSGRPISSAVLTYVLYDAQGREVGRVNDDVIGPIPPGQIRLVKAVTPLQFTKVTVLDVRAQ
ncbi:FxLYD domain-containing protein [Achromobacter spanius]|uniref:FxLYD domain-containing protein n=1 Tax=Achromobacter spanius TaxID=217203 RepID=UPI003F690221